MDVELKQYLDSRFAAIDSRFAAMETRFGAVEAELRAAEARLNLLITEVSQSHSRELAEIRQTLSQLNSRVDRMSAGSHYVSRLTEWADKQERFGEDILTRIQLLERKVDKLEKNQPPSQAA